MSEISVLVPSYNHAQFIDRTLRSIFGQSVKPRKLIVIDDGSKDDSPQIIERILKDCPFDSELIVRENRGLCATLNQGFSLSNAKYFAYLGSDDFWLPEFLAERVRLLESRESAILGYGHALFVDDNDNIFDTTSQHRENWANYPDGDAKPMLLKGIAPVSSTVFYRSSALDKVSWNEKSRLEDYEMYLKLVEVGDFAFDPQVLSAWRHHAYNTSKDKLLMLREVIEAQNRNIKSLGVSEIELKKFQTKTKFRYARMLLQYGDKMGAIRLSRQSWRGVESPFQLGKFIIRLGVPMSIVNFRRKLRKDRYSRLK